MSSWELETLKESLCSFPKHDGETWYDIIQRDHGYARWAVENIESMDDELREALQWGIDHVAERF